MPAPQPVYGPGTRLTDLGTAENLLAVTLRLFALAWRQQEGREPDTTHSDWREGFEAAGLACWAGISFAALFHIVIAATRRPLDVRCLHARELGYDEGRLLQMVSLFQHSQIRHAEAVLESWLPDAAKRMALSPAAGLARALAQGDLVIPLRPGMMKPSPYPLQANRGLMLVH